MTFLLLSQMAIILVCSRICGAALRWLGQPPVVAEMLAGALLGPLALGALAPDLHAALFPPHSIPSLTAVGNVGLVLFMFIVGVKLHTAPTSSVDLLSAGSWIAGSSIAIPAALGFMLSPVLYSGFAPGGVAFGPFALFIATALAVTALPVMARILEDERLAHTAIGRVSLAAAAVTDVVAWMMLVVIVGLSTQESAASGVRHIAVSALGLAALMIALRSVARRFARKSVQYSVDTSDATFIAAVLVGLFASAAVTESLQLHPALGALLFGACLPRDVPAIRTFTTRAQQLVVIGLLPAFFATTGLAMDPDAFTGAGGLAFVMLLTAAVAGKLLGGMAGARLAGFKHRDCLAVGALMNARGLMELVVIRVGLDIGVLNAALYTMLAIVALVTTMMTGPLLKLWARGSPRNEVGVSYRTNASERPDSISTIALELPSHDKPNRDDEA